MNLLEDLEQMNNTSQREVEFPDLDKRGVIIAMKGLPCTGKSEIAMLIGKWASCTVLSVDDFLDTLSFERGYNSESFLSIEEAERLHRLAFNTLCKATARHLRLIKEIRLRECVVIKSRLCSTFELDGLIKLAQESNCNVMIIECQVKNEHRFNLRLEFKVERFGHEEWYKPRSRMDIQKARDDYDPFQAQSWDLHLLQMIKNSGYFGDDYDSPWFKRLVLDLFDDLNLSPKGHLTELTPAFKNAIRHLLLNEDEDSDSDSLSSNEDVEEYLYRRIHKEEKYGYMMVEFDELRRTLLEKKLKTSSSEERSKYLCTTDGGCVFKYSEELQYQGGENGCGVCGERVDLGTPAYACYFCILTLHKACAETHKYNIGEVRKEFLSYFICYNISNFPEEHACRSCTERGEGYSIECKSCFFTTHLKCRLLPTIIKHDCHPQHFLSMQLTNGNYFCNACGVLDRCMGGYGCNICRLHYDIACAFIPGKGKHEHGGHEHVMEALYSRVGMEKEEGYWCGICYEDVDPQHWFFSCQSCPYYVAHPGCAMIKLEQLS